MNRRRLVLSAVVAAALALPAAASGDIQQITPTIKADVGTFNGDPNHPAWNGTITWDSGCTLPHDTPGAYFSWMGAIFMDPPFETQIDHPSPTGPHPGEPNELGGGPETPTSGSMPASFGPGSVLVPFIEAQCQTGPTSDQSNAPADYQSGSAHGERIAVPPFARPAQALEGRRFLFDPRRAPVGEQMRVTFEYGCHASEGIRDERCVYHVDGAGLHLSRNEGRVNADEQFVHLDFKPKRPGTIRITLVEQPYGLRSNDHLEVKVVPKSRARMFPIGSPHRLQPVPAVVDP